MIDFASLRFRLRLRPGLLLGLLIAAALAAACRKGAGPGFFSLDSLRQLHEATRQGAVQPTEYRLDSQPFSPTLSYLFDQARIVVLPPAAVGKPSAGSGAAACAFSAVDRFGRIYHFDAQARWWMAEGETLPAPLPPGGWSAAWNAQSGALELLVSAPWNGEPAMHLLRWLAGRWSQPTLASPPEARPGACRLFLAASQRWLVAGGGVNGGWTVENTAWKPWVGASADGRSPDFGKIATLLDGPAGAAPIALTQTGAIWIWNGQAWKETGSVKIENLALASYVPTLEQVLFVWHRGRGQDQFLWQTIRQLESGSNSSPEILPQTALVRVNDRDEGFWKGWGRAHAEKDRFGQTRESLTPCFQGSGEPAIQLNSQGQDRIFRAGAISLLELPPDLGALRFEAAAWVPALDGIVAPSASGIGINARREPFFPPEARDPGATSATQPLIDVIQQHYRFWIFRQKSFDWLKPPTEVHPDIDYANSYQTPDGCRRCLAWTAPEPGLLRYDYHEFHDKKVQWVNSPRLTLKKIPQLALTPGDQIYTCDPVVWGDPAEVILVGWCGRLGPPARFEKAPEGLSDEAYAQVPGRGFMARISALEPTEWKVTTLPIPFCEGAQVVVDPAHDSLYLLGGKTFEQQTYQGKKLYFARSNSAVWHWDGEAWRCIQPDGGSEPRNKVTSHVVVDPAVSQLLCLTPRALYSFRDDVWHTLWEQAKSKGDWPRDVALYVHPLSRLVLGAWFMPAPILRVWNGQGWTPVRLTGAATPNPGTTATLALAAGGILPATGPNLIPATEPDTFIAIDAERLNAIRMDAPRDRDQDRLMSASRLVFRPANAGPIAFARGSGIRHGPPAPDAAAAPLAVAATAPTAPQEADADDAADGVRVLAGNDGKVIKKNHTDLLMRRLEALAAQ